MKATGEQGARAAERRGEARGESGPAMRGLLYEMADDTKALKRERLAEAFGQTALRDTDNAERLRDRAAPARNKAKEIGK